MNIIQRKVSELVPYSKLIACEQIDRTCYMIEYEAHYVDVIIKRWETLTGEKAVLLSDD